MTRNNTIPCSVGILTFNSEKNLQRALESVKDFSDIIISDGGSTDDTLDIARKFNATIIEQYAKDHPGPEPRHPITDFAQERNRILEVAKEPWYLWIDSDEHISSELCDEIAAVVQGDEYSGCRLPMQLQSPDGSVTYQSPTPVYQTRLVQKELGSFQRKIHERFVFTEQPRLKTLSGAWYVPISKPDFATYKWAVNYRLRIMYETKPPGTFMAYLRRGWFRPVRNVLGVLYRLFRLYLTTPWRQVPPLYYFRNRLYSQWVTFRLANRLYFGRK